MTVNHPLAMLTADEIAEAVRVLCEARSIETPLFSTITLHEPDKATLAAWTPGQPVEREVKLVVVTGPHALAEAVVSVTAGEVRSWVDVPGVRPPLLFSEIMYVIDAVKTDPRFQAALAKRGITDMDRVQIDPWPAGTWGDPLEEGRRISRVIAYERHYPNDNGYARPIEGVVAVVDLTTREILEVQDHGVVPIPVEESNYDVEWVEANVGPLRTDLKPISITQPDGPSFTVEGNLVRWQRWQLRVSMDPIEGLVLHQLGYEDGGRVRPILHRASLSEMVVPYGSVAPGHYWKNAFDAGEWGMGRFVNSLTLGCDCLGEIHYFDAVLASEQGTPYTVENAICMHEEDYGILWKHQDLHAGTTEVRRSRRLVISSIYTIGNYEYGFFWYLYLDGTIQLEAKLTGIVQTQAFAGDDVPPQSNPIAPGLAAPHHQHLFCVRLDLDIDGGPNTVYEIDAVPLPPGPDNPHANAFEARATCLERESAAKRDVDAARARTWNVVNPGVHNRLGRPVAYKLRPMSMTPTIHAAPEASVHRRAGFAAHNLWVTPYRRDELRAAGPYSNQSPGGDGLPAWTAADRSLVDTDVVLWYSFGVTHFVRPEDFPVMPVEYCGFWLVPYGFFDHNPALDVPPAPGHACHA